jgi:hypothetical protein
VRVEEVGDIGLAQAEDADFTLGDLGGAPGRGAL